MKTINKELFNKEIAPKIKERLNLTTIMAVPKLEKIIINMGCGDASANAKIIDEVIEQLQMIAGQKPVKIKAKKSIAAFKLREGMPIGAKVTLRNKNMYNFLNKLINLALPRTRDFQGVPKNSFDGQGNYTLGIKEQIIFPEIEFDKINKIRGMDITFVISSGSKEQSFVLLEELGMPFAKR